MSHEVAETDANLEEIRRLRAELDTTRADLESLRVGMVWLGEELDRAKRWGALWKRAAKDERENAIIWAGAHAQTHIELGRVRRACQFAVDAYHRQKSRIQKLQAALDSARAYADEVEQERADFRDKFLDAARKNAELRTETAPALLDTRREWAQSVLDNLRLRRAARLLVVAWRQERQAAAYWAGAVDLYRVALERAQERADRLSGAESDENSPDHPTV